MNKISQFLGGVLTLACLMGRPASGETTAGQALDFRTDINPALLYFQAYQEMPQLSEEDTQHVFGNWTGGAWPDQPFDQHALGLIRQYDNSFALLRRARLAKVPCDWGYDLSNGPYALLPGLAPAKRLAQVTRLRAMIALDSNSFDSLREDYAGALALGRNLSTDHVLISALVQFACENILTSVVMENYYRLSADQLDQLVAVIDSAPRRGTIADTIPPEDNFFFGFIRREIERLATDTKGNSDLFWSRFGPFWNPIATDAESGKGPDPSAERIREVCESDPATVVRLVREMSPLYTETHRLMSLPYAEYKEKAPAHWARTTESKNPFVKVFFSALKNVRGKEFGTIVRQEMIRAAAAYKRGGMAALRNVQDPLVGGLFEFSRVQFEGVDRGFRLKCREPFRDFNEMMIFVEKPGKHFRLDGKNAGTNL